MAKAFEIRSVPGTAEVREVNGVKTLTGKAVVYNSWSEPIYSMFKERLAPGCFDESLQRGGDIIATVDHDPKRLLGRMYSRTLLLNPSPEGIDAECSLSPITYAQDLAASIARGDIRGMSFTFDVIADTWANGPDGPERTVVKADLYEVSWVVFPAYPATTADLRGGYYGASTEVRDKVLASMRAALGQQEVELLRMKLEILEKM